MDCSGACRPGYYCPLGSTSDTQEVCGVGFFCPGGSSARLPIENFECGIGSSLETCYDVELCLTVASIFPSSSPTKGWRTISFCLHHRSQKRRWWCLDCDWFAFRQCQCHDWQQPLRNRSFQLQSHLFDLYHSSRSRYQFGCCDPVNIFSIADSNSFQCIFV